jgi:hypothetical protein
MADTTRKLLGQLAESPNFYIGGNAQPHMVIYKDMLIEGHGQRESLTNGSLQETVYEMNRKL